MNARTPIALLLSTALAACSGGTPVPTASVMSHTRCKNLSAGVHLVSLAEVAAIRGSTLIESSGLGLPADATVLSAPPAMADSAAGEADAEALPPWFVAVSRGLQPSRGYELHLAGDARAEHGTVTVPVFWTAPEAGTAQPQVTTHPCLVISVPRGPFQSVAIVDQAGTELGTLKLPQPIGG